MMQHPLNILEQYWNFTSFKPLQEDIIDAVLKNDDIFALLPTGGGKSICFQIPTLAKEGLCIVVSPLIALMNDQVEALKQKGIKAMALTSKYNFNEVNVMLDNCIYGHYKFLYLSPERLQQEIVQERIRQMNVNLIAVDEAHCISQWGNDFRPAYKNISILRDLHPQVNIIALTASATKEVVTDIIKEMDLIQPKIFKQSFLRKNLAYMVFDEEDKNYKIEQILKKNPESSIIYVRNRKSTISLCNHLEKKGFECTYYHGGLSFSEKEEHFNAWMYERKQVMVSTNAFGMGIDKANVKTVIHINLPESIESYFQEAGRAGRNGEKAYAIILKNKGDESMIKKQFLSVLPSIDFVKLLYRKLSNYFQIPYGEGDHESFEFNFNAFCKAYDFNTMIAYNAMQILDRTSVISLSKQFQNQTMVQVLVSNQELFKYFENDPDSAIILKAILRTYGGIFDHETKINTLLMADKANSTEDQVNTVLQKLENQNIISLKYNKTDAQITFLQPREDDKTIHRISRIIEQQNRLKIKQVTAVIDYINSDSICKSSWLLSYFDETNARACGICSVCIKSASLDTKDSEGNSIKRIISILHDNSLSSREISEMTNLDETNVLSILKLLLENNKIAISSSNTYTLKK